MTPGTPEPAPHNNDTPGPLKPWSPGDWPTIKPSSAANPTAIEMQHPIEMNPRHGEDAPLRGMPYIPDAHEEAIQKALQHINELETNIRNRQGELNQHVQENEARRKRMDELRDRARKIEHELGEVVLRMMELERWIQINSDAANNLKAVVQGLTRQVDDQPALPFEEPAPQPAEGYRPRPGSHAYQALMTIGELWPVVYSTLDAYLRDYNTEIHAASSAMSPLKRERLVYEVGTDEHRTVHLTRQGRAVYHELKVKAQSRTRPN